MLFCTRKQIANKKHGSVRKEGVYNILERMQTICTKGVRGSGAIAALACSERITRLPLWTGRLNAPLHGMADRGGDDVRRSDMQQVEGGLACASASVAGHATRNKCAKSCDGVGWEVRRQRQWRRVDRRCLASHDLPGEGVRNEGSARGHGIRLLIFRDLANVTTHIFKETATAGGMTAADLLLGYVKFTRPFFTLKSSKK